jgi:hypothetical protein
MPTPTQVSRPDHLSAALITAFSHRLSRGTTSSASEDGDRTDDSIPGYRYVHSLHFGFTDRLPLRVRHEANFSTSTVFLPSAGILFEHPMLFIRSRFLGSRVSPTHGIWLPVLDYKVITSSGVRGGSDSARQLLIGTASTRRRDAR